MTRALLLLTALLVGCATQNPVTTPFPEPQPPQNVAASLEAVLAEAESENRLVMLVLGGNWCHDSTDFAVMIEQPGLKPWIESHYVVALINTGYLEHVEDYLQPFGVPAMYGTPTVLVIDPVTRGVRNLDRHYYWRNASQLDAQAAREYFGRYLQAPAPPPPASPALAEALARIDNFEAQQGQRIYKAYAVLGELMREGDAGGMPADFENKWMNLGKMRGQITTDLESLRQSAREQDAVGTSPIELSFPDYSLFTD